MDTRGTSSSPVVRPAPAGAGAPVSQGLRASWASAAARLALLGLLVVLSLVVIPQRASAQTGPTMNAARTYYPGDPREFAIYWTFWAPERAWFNLDFTDVPWHTNLKGIPTAWADKYPRAGPHMIDLYEGGKEAFYRDHFAGLRVNIDLVAPDVNFDGVLYFDYEFWAPFWTGHWNEPSTQGLTADDFDPIDDWREHIRTSRPQLLVGLDAAAQEEVFRQTWLAQTREFFERCFNEMKRLRPRSRVGFYNFPSQNYWGWFNPTIAAKLNFAYENEMTWFFEMVDIIMPNTYVFYQSVDAAVAPRGYYDTRARFNDYMRNNVGLAVRLARGKPVLNFIGWQYHPAYAPAPLGPLNEWNLRRSFEASRELGASGVVVFGWIQNQQQYDAAVPFVRDTLNPFVRSFAQLPSLAPELNPSPLTPPNIPTSPPDGTPATPPQPPAAPPDSAPVQGPNQNPNQPAAPPLTPANPPAPSTPASPAPALPPSSDGPAGGFAPVPPPPGDLDADVQPSPLMPGFGGVIGGAPVPTIPQDGQAPSQGTSAETSPATGKSTTKSTRATIVTGAAPTNPAAGVRSVRNAGPGGDVSVVFKASAVVNDAAPVVATDAQKQPDRATFTDQKVLAALARARGLLDGAEPLDQASRSGIAGASGGPMTQAHARRTADLRALAEARSRTRSVATAVAGVQPQPNAAPPAQ